MFGLQLYSSTPSFHRDLFNESLVLNTLFESETRSPSRFIPRQGLLYVPALGLCDVTALLHLYILSSKSRAVLTLFRDFQSAQSIRASLSLGDRAFPRYSVNRRRNYSCRDSLSRPLPDGDSVSEIRDRRPSGYCKAHSFTVRI